jgi:hypothetical protein
MSSIPVMGFSEAASSPSWKRWSALAATHWDRWLASVWLLVACKLIIGGVSAFDTYLTIKYAASLDIYELNPLGRWMMGLDDGPVAGTQQIAAFIGGKFLGTVLVLLALELVASWRARLSGMLALPVALFQLILLVHLTYG